MMLCIRTYFLLKSCVLKVFIAFYSVLIRTMCFACLLERISLLSDGYAIRALDYLIYKALCPYNE